MVFQLVATWVKLGLLRAVAIFYGGSYAQVAMYSPLRAWQKDDMPLPPFVSISVGTHSESDGQIFLSPELMSDGEIDYAVDQLKGELEEFRKAAKKELRTLKTKMLQK